MRWGRAAAFLAVLMALHAVLFTVYTRVVGDGHKATRSDRAFVRGPDELDLLVLGDSHPRTAILPRVLGEKVVNAAVGGEHYLKTWYRMRALLDGTGKSVKTLLLPFDASSFSSWHAENFAPEFIWGRYVDYFEVGRIRGEPWTYTTLWAKGRLFPYAGELRTLNQIRTKRFGFGEDLPGGSLAERSEAERRGLALGQAREHFKGAEIVDPGLRWAFDNTLGWARERDIDVVLVAFPVTRDYAEWTDRAGARERVHTEVLEPLLAQGDVTFVDLRDLFFEHDQLFADPHHVNAAGRTIFSRQLKKRLVELGVLQD